MTLSVEALCERLDPHGFEIRGRSRSHVLLGAGRDRIIVPTTVGTVPRSVLRCIELRFERALGKTWLRTAAGAAAQHGRQPAPRTLHAATVADDEGWAAFVVEEPALFTHGPTIEHAQDLLRDAAALWYGTTPARIHLQWCDHQPTAVSP